MKDLSTVQASGLNRRSFPARASLAGGAVLLPQIVVPQSGRAEDKGDNYSWWDEDKKILIAAEIAEALAATTYTNIETSAKGRLSDRF